MITKLSSYTLGRLSQIPEPGDTHRWMIQIAGAFKQHLRADACSAFLKECRNRWVTHRDLTDDEIERIVAYCYGAKETGGAASVTSSWPSADPEVIQRVLEKVEPSFDTGDQIEIASAEQALSALFLPGDKICAGPASDRAQIRKRNEWLPDADRMQFVVVNPMKGEWGHNKTGKRSVRCQSNVRVRRYLVAEFDDPAMDKVQQARLVTALGQVCPLRLVVDSGGKSLHAWYWVKGLSLKDQTRFFALCCLFGADPTRWDACGWLRMPGGLRPQPDQEAVRQRILFLRSDKEIPGERGVQHG